MKQRLSKKLVLNKTTITSLEMEGMNRVKGGTLEKSAYRACNTMRNSDCPFKYEQPQDIFDPQE